MSYLQTLSLSLRENMHMSAHTVELKHDPTGQGMGYLQKSGARIELVTHWEVVGGADQLNFTQRPKVGKEITLPACGACVYSRHCTEMVAEAGNTVVLRKNRSPYIDASAILRLPSAQEAELLGNLERGVGANRKVLSTIYEFGAPLPCAKASTFNGRIE